MKSLSAILSRADELARSRRTLPVCLGVIVGFLLLSLVWRLGPAAWLAVPLPLSALAITVLLRRARMRCLPIVVVLAALGFYVYYVWTTPFQLRNYDWNAHKTYVEYLLSHHALPGYDVCNECHHPPAYHVLGAAVFAFCARAGVAEPTKGGQVLSLVLFLVFLCFAALTIARLTPRLRSQTLATALVAFWPYSVINSARLNNDIFIYATASVSMYGLVRWYQKPRRGWLAFAAGFACMGILSKSTALLTVAMVGLVALVRLLRSRDWRGLLRTSWPVLLAIALAGLGSLALHSRNQGTFLQRELGHAYLEKHENSPFLSLAERTPRVYLTFSFRAMLDQPFAEYNLRKVTEPTYWNHLLKSSLYGTQQYFKREYPGPVRDIAKKYASLMNRLLLGLTAVVLVGLVGRRPVSSSRRLFCAAAIVAFLSGSLAFHLAVPSQHHADFRFVFPVVVPMSVLYAHGVEVLRRWRIFAGWAAQLLAIVFLVTSVVSFIDLSTEPTVPPSVPTLNTPRWMQRRIPGPMGPAAAPPSSSAADPTRH